MAGTAAIIFTVFIIGLCLFQLNLAAGAPWGRLAWGGQHVRLPTPLRIASLGSIALYVALAAIILARAGMVPWWRGDAWLSPASWVIAGVLGLGIVMNLISRSRPERLVMAPVATVLAGTAALVAAGI